MVAPISINLATEDELSEEVALRLIKEVSKRFEVGLRLRKGGFGYLKSNLPKFYEMAIRTPMLLLTDLDQNACPIELIQGWSGKLKKPDQLIFRVAVREIESWLLADRTAMAKFLSCKENQLPDHPDREQDPKQTLLNIARRYANRHIRSDIVAEKGTVASQSLGYNYRMCEFVRNQWEPERAAERSDSLNRALKRLRELAQIM